MSWLQTVAFIPRPPDSRPIRVIEQEIFDELQFHLEMRTLDNVGVGMSDAEARQDAVRRFGDFDQIHRTCRRTLLGERIMLQRVQTVLMVVLVGAVVFLAVVFYAFHRGQQENRLAMALLMAKNEAATALLMQKNEAAEARMLQKLEQFEKIAARPAPTAVDPGPSVVATVPKTGDRDVDPSLTEIRVTYNVPMMDGNWSWCYDPESLKTTGKPHYEADSKTCVLPVKLEPGKTYAISLNTHQFRNFKDAAGRSAIPYVLQFNTRR